MLICDRCRTAIPDGARFCPSCGDPVTAADLPANRAGQGVERVRLVCPRCEQQALHDLPAHGRARVQCPACAAEFDTRVVSIKAKRSAGNKKHDTRRFTVRVEDLNGREDLIEFDRSGNQDFELRSRDLAAFSSQAGALQVVQNLTLGRYMRLRPPSAGCGGGVAATAILLLVFLGFCALTNDGSTDTSGSSTAYDTRPAPASYPVAPPAPSADPLYVHGALNVRSAPNRSAAVLRTLRRGDLVRLGPKDANGWAPIYDASGTPEGYVYRASDLVRSTAPAVQAESGTLGSGTSRGSSSGYYTGPRGGCYTYSASGRKRYVDRSYCSTAPAVQAQSRTSGTSGTSASRGSSSGYYTGPRGGCYTYSASGRKRYVDRSYCN